jgi:hypothetical protein
VKKNRSVLDFGMPAMPIEKSESFGFVLQMIQPKEKFTE